MKGTTRQQERALEIIRKYVSENGYPPSVREIGERIGLSSSSSVHSLLSALEKRGLVKRDPTKPRALFVTKSEAEKEARGPVPIVGRVAAGVPILAEENREGDFVLDESCLKKGTFMLRVRGESMIDAHIKEDDLIVVHPCHEASNGDIVVALIDGEATVKRFFKERGRVRLQPENKAMAPIYTRNVRIVGKVGAVIRTTP